MPRRKNPEPTLDAAEIARRLPRPASGRSAVMADWVEGAVLVGLEVYVLTQLRRNLRTGVAAAMVAGWLIGWFWPRPW